MADRFTLMNGRKPVLWLLCNDATTYHVPDKNRHCTGKVAENPVNTRVCGVLPGTMSVQGMAQTAQQCVTTECFAYLTE